MTETKERNYTHLPRSFSDHSHESSSETVALELSRYGDGVDTPPRLVHAVVDAHALIDPAEAGQRIRAGGVHGSQGEEIVVLRMLPRTEAVEVPPGVPVVQVSHGGELFAGKLDDLWNVVFAAHCDVDPGVHSYNRRGRKVLGPSHFREPIRSRNDAAQSEAADILNQ